MCLCIKEAMQSCHKIVASTPPRASLTNIFLATMSMHTFAPLLAASDSRPVLAASQALRKSLLETERVTFAVPDAPVFRPTAEEFQDPLGYISSIQGSATAAGIAKIIPPPGAQRAPQHY